MENVKTLSISLIIFISLIRILAAQNIYFYPETDTMKVIDGCTGPEIICTLSSNTDLDSIIISPGFNTYLEYLDSQGIWRIINKCYFLISDTSNIYDYELFYWPLGLLPYFQQINFDTTFYTWDNFFNIILVVKAQGNPVDSLKQLFKSEYGLGIDDKIGKISERIELYSNYPNPFNSSTTISYSLSRRSNVRLSIYNILGQLVKTLLNEDQFPGEYSINWNAANLNSGIYYIHLESEGYRIAKICLLIK